MSFNMFHGTQVMIDLLLSGAILPDEVIELSKQRVFTVTDRSLNIKFLNTVPERGRT